METVYELVSPEHSRPVLVQPLGEYFPSRWVKAKEHHAPSVLELLAKDAQANVLARVSGHAAPQHTGFALDTFRNRGLKPVDLPDAIPGIHISIDRDAKRVRLFDPLETLPNRAEIEAAFHAIYHRYRVPKPEQVYDRLSEADLDVWQAWLDKAVSEGVAVKCEPAEPEPEPVEQPAAESESVPQEPEVQETAAPEPTTETEQPPVAPQPVKSVKPVRRR